MIYKSCGLSLKEHMQGSFQLVASSYVLQFMCSEFSRGTNAQGVRGIYALSTHCILNYMELTAAAEFFVEFLCPREVMRLEAAYVRMHKLFAEQLYIWETLLSNILGSDTISFYSALTSPNSSIFWKHIYRSSVLEVTWLERCIYAILADTPRFPIDLAFDIFLPNMVQYRSLPLLFMNQWPECILRLGLYEIEHEDNDGTFIHYQLMISGRLDEALATQAKAFYRLYEKTVDNVYTQKGDSNKEPYSATRLWQWAERIFNISLPGATGCHRWACLQFPKEKIPFQSCTVAKYIRQIPDHIRRLPFHISCSLFEAMLETKKQKQEFQGEVIATCEVISYRTAGRTSCDASISVQPFDLQQDRDNRIVGVDIFGPGIGRVQLTYVIILQELMQWARQAKLPFTLRFGSRAETGGSSAEISRAAD